MYKVSQPVSSDIRVTDVRYDRAESMQDMALDIRGVEQLSPEEIQHLFGWGENIFDTAHLNLTYRPKDSRDRRFVLYEAQVPVSHAGVLQHHAHANGRRALIGGVGGVVTVPGARRRGHAGRLLRHAAAFLRDEWKVDFALLFCIDQRVGFYQRLEWAEVSCEVLIDQPTGRVPCPVHVMALPFKPEFSRIEALDLGSPSW
jgi:GNAT superfamily N-acetyltransferase